MKNYQLPKVPENVHTSFTAVCHIMANFCKAKLNEEYFQISVKLAEKIARKRRTPLLTGNATTWAAGIIHAIGMVNFLFDKTQTPHITSRELCEWFALGQSTVSAKSKVIRTMLKISQWDSTWYLPSRIDQHPTAWLVAIDGYIMDIRQVDPEIQLAAYQAGVIPYLPRSKKVS
jgi:hypothetical protein